MSGSLSQHGSGIEAYLESQAQKSLLRFVTCGSAGDGKSTLIGRMLYESKMLFDDQMASLESESARMGTQGKDIDFALLVDGLAPEREQGNTIDVGYRFFSTERRKFVVADTPGREQYTRNMVTGASTADLAIIVIDARKGVLDQTRRHAFLAALLGIRHFVLAINKMDTVDYERSVYEEIDVEFRDFAAGLNGEPHIETIPISALRGDNVAERSETMDWYHGPTLMSFLQTVDISAIKDNEAFTMPVQLVSRPSSDFRGFAGTITSGHVSVGDRVKALPSARESTISRIVTADGDLTVAGVEQAVTLTLADEIDISRGDVIGAADNPLEVADQFEATIVWMSETPMLAGRSYAFKLATNNARVTVTALKHRINVNTMEEMAANSLELNEIGLCNISLDRRIPFAPYAQNKALGGFIVIDRLTNETIGMGMINFALRRASNVHLQAFDVDRDARAGIKDHGASILWFTGLSGSGKSTIANILERKLVAGGHHTILLDGDNVRHGLNRDLGFTDADRVENIRRIGEVARLMTDAGLIVMVSFISPFASERRMARRLAVDGEFVEIYVSTPLEVAEERDVKGLYKKARAGEIKNFTGIDSPYEEPESAEIVVDTSQTSAEDAADIIMAHLAKTGVIKG